MSVSPPSATAAHITGPGISPLRRASITAATVGSDSNGTPRSGGLHAPIAAEVRSPVPYAPASSMPAAMMLNSGAPAAA